MSRNHEPPADAEVLAPAKPGNLNGYYRGVVLPLMAEHCGYESHQEQHEALKAAFDGKDPREKQRSMAEMKPEERRRFIDYAIRQAAELGLVIPEPRNSLDAAKK